VETDGREKRSFMPEGEGESAVRSYLREGGGIRDVWGRGRKGVSGFLKRSPLDEERGRKGEGSKEGGEGGVDVFQGNVCREK